MTDWQPPTEWAPPPTPAGQPKPKRYGWIIAAVVAVVLVMAVAASNSEGFRELAEVATTTTAPESTTTTEPATTTTTRPTTTTTTEPATTTTTEPATTTRPTTSTTTTAELTAADAVRDSFPDIASAQALTDEQLAELADIACRLALDSVNDSGAIGADEYFAASVLLVHDGLEPEAKAAISLDEYSRLMAGLLVAYCPERGTGLNG